MCEHQHASTRTRYDREAAELHCEIVCDSCGKVIRLVETVRGYRPRYEQVDFAHSENRPA